MTPNSNPSPEAIMCGGCGETNSEKRCIGCMHDFGTPESAWVQKYATAALSPQTLPAPGEVELREAYIAGFAQALYNLELTPNAFFDAWLDFGQYYGLEKEQFDPDVIHTPALATVAAANDEGVAGQVSRLRAAYDAVADWPEKRGDPMTVGGAGFMDLLKLRNLVAELLDDPAAIGLLSQGGGK